MTFVDPGVIGECDARTQGVFISGICARPRPRQRAAERGRATQASSRESLLIVALAGNPHRLGRRNRSTWGDRQKVRKS